VRLAAVAAALAVVLAGCGKGGEDEERGTLIEVTATSGRDREIGTELHSYLEDGCQRIGSLEEWRAGIVLSEEPRVLRRYLAHRYGGVDRAFESFRSMCESYRAIRVEDGVITVETALRGGLARVRGSDLCNLIQGSDVADFTPGHRVLGDDGSQLAECPARNG
jgi:hypothetical protein